MANTITFTFKTEAPYTNDELEALQFELTEMVEGADGDLVPNTCEIGIQTPDEMVAADLAKVKSVLDNANVKLSVQVEDEDENVLMKEDLNSAEL